MQTFLIQFFPVAADIAKKIEVSASGKFPSKFKGHIATAELFRGNSMMKGEEGEKAADSNFIAIYFLD